MKIETNNVLTVSQLRSMIVDVADDIVIEFVRTVTPKPKMTGECWCGCGGETKGKFVPGHDSKFHSLAKKVARGQAEMPTSFIHEDAEADFMKWYDATLEADAAKPAKAKPEPKAVKPKPEPKVVETQEEDNEEGEELDVDSEEFKALVASVTMS